MTEGATTIKREFGIDMGHRIPLHNSKCRNLHGHRYKIVLEVEGGLCKSGSSSGMIVDFSMLKWGFKSIIDHYFDHGLTIQDNDLVILDPLFPGVLKEMRRVNYVDPEHLPLYTESCKMRWPLGGDVFFVKSGKYDASSKLVITPFPPTAEHLAQLWFYILDCWMRNYAKEEKVDYLNMRSIEVWETPNCVATYKE